jgi:predicted SAM-dependent methyltransferase/glycosyltransferase involved in cell wall biosynthesis
MSDNVIIGYKVGEKIVANLQLPFKNTDKVLEVGCGETPLMHTDNWKTMDYRKLPNIDFVGDLEQKWPVEDNSFDGIYGTFVIEHMTWRKTPFFISECFRVLKPGGHVYMVGPNTLEQCKAIVAKGDITITESAMIFGGQDEGGWNAHKAAFSPNFAIKLFAEAGFKDIKVEPWIGAITDMVITASKENIMTIPYDSIKLNIGSFTVMSKGWVNCDILDLKDYANKNGFVFDQFDASKKIPYHDNSVSLIVASHFLEHLDRAEGAKFLEECFRVLKINGIIRITVPDAKILAKYYLEDKIQSVDNEEIKKLDSVSAFVHMLVGGHKTVYDMESLFAMMSGFSNLTVRKPGESGSSEIQSETKDMYPDHSIYVEGTKIEHPAMYKTVDVPMIKVSEKNDHIEVKDKLRIGLISTQFFGVPPTGYSGLERVVWDLAMGLSKLGHYVRIFGPEGSKNVPNGSVVITGPAYDTVKSNWEQAEKLGYEVCKDKLDDLDIVHGHNWFGIEYASRIKNPKIKICHTHHGHMDPGYWLHSRPPFMLNFIGISKFMQKEYISQGMNSEYAYNGVDMTKYKFKENKGDRLIFIGRLDTFKQPHVAINVAKRLGMTLDIFGGSFVQDKKYLEDIKALCDGKQIVMHLDASQGEKVQYLQDAKCLLFPSKMLEPFGLVAIEAMACGTPVVALDDGAIREVIGEKALIAKDEDQMVEMVSDVNRYPHVDLRKFVNDRYSQVASAEQYVKLYQKILVGEEW